VLCLDNTAGKSQFLKYAAKVISRSVVTTGIGTTSAGLTVTAVKVCPLGANLAQHSSSYTAGYWRVDS
jgi:DNA replicative helicase MCM subunit Mcm2 (Cdc46/Mcm family)